MTTFLCAMINFLLYIRKVLLIFKSSKGLSQHGYSFLIDQTPSAGRVSIFYQEPTDWSVYLNSCSWPVGLISVRRFSVGLLSLIAAFVLQYILSAQHRERAQNQMLTTDCASQRINTGCWYQYLHRKRVLYFHAYNDDDNNQDFCYLTTNVEANIKFLHSLLVWYLKVG